MNVDNRHVIPKTNLFDRRIVPVMLVMGMLATGLIAALCIVTL